MEEVIESNNIVENMIYEIRGVQVMLDSDLAKLYECKNGTKDINKAVKRNINRFPSDFYFQLTEDELKIISLRFQIGTLNKNNNLRGMHYKYLPYVFTQEGVSMLASVLHTKVAEEVSVKIMRSFVKMRHYINYNNDLLPNKVLLLEKKVDDNTKRIDEMFDKFEPKNITKDYIFFEGEFYDAYSLLVDIFNKSKKEIVLIDNYAGKDLLDILKSIDRKIIIISKNVDNVLKSKYESQYTNVSFINNDSFHDRFIILDRKIIYSCGSSFKDLGKKCFSIQEIKSQELLDYIKNVFNH